MTMRFLGVAGGALATGVAAVGFAQLPGVDQPLDPAAVAERAALVVATVEAVVECDVSAHGEPRYDEFSERWLVAYSAAGSQCSDVNQALQRDGASLGLMFFRRPNADEVRALIGRIRASVERGFGCRIWLKGEPRFNEDSSFWAAEYLMAGAECSGAGEELQRQGRELGIGFHRVSGRR
jgi:hypothetical protein